ncbi:hypothetical protein [Streptomyces sp. NBC_01198]|uniref:hypothetical protein n=1 Tax=Streptomyces sp. NBC_01198 TaxID=2903769 RepID=UPI002E16378B|nr:hypothetical protein OG702_06165 [Streptomyces sp. NBC_01198]
MVAADPESAFRSTAEPPNSIIGSRAGLTQNGLLVHLAPLAVVLVLVIAGFLLHSVLNSAPSIIALLSAGLLVAVSGFSLRLRCFALV